MRAWLETFTVALRLGLTSFGGPVAHLGYYRDEYVRRRAWLGDRDYADLVALCQMLPGPTSSQVGFAVGVRRAGLLGGVGAALGFTLPSALLMGSFAAWVGAPGGGALVGMKAAAVAVVANAVAGMARALCPDRARLTLAVGVAAALALAPGPWAQVLAIAIGALCGIVWLPGAGEDDAPDPASRTGSLRATVLWAVAFAALLAVPAVVARATGSELAARFDLFARAGSLVFGGGHVILPLLEVDVVRGGLVDRDTFLAGYGAAQALPGPLFTFATFLGVASADGGTGAAVLGGLLATVAIFVPGLLLVLAALPVWDRLRHARRLRRALAGANAAVVGLLLAALYDPVWQAGVRGAGSFAVALGAWVALSQWGAPAWAVVIGAAALGAGLLER